MDKGKTQRLVVCLVILSVCRTTETLGLELREWVADRNVSMGLRQLRDEISVAW